MSDTSVSFHHASPYEMQLLDYLVDRLKIKSASGIEYPKMTKDLTQ